MRKTAKAQQWIQYQIPAQPLADRIDNYIFSTNIMVVGSDIVSCGIDTGGCGGDGLEGGVGKKNEGRLTFY